ncbi:MAG TPA: TlpA disulfide reductase family protein, partial [Acidiferrobacterales bacterium]|nr:TlpA disulfide reductase family protein [Acidiferrobacterales bacterium]
QARDVRLADGIDVPVSVHAARGDALLLWLPSGIPGATSDALLAEKMRAHGIEVWRADVLEARFLPALESSLEQVPDSDIVALIEAARASGRRVTLLASARAGLLALRGAHAWQTAHPGAAGLDGVILLHPNLYLGPPEPGREAEFHPVVARTHLPVHVIQPEKSPWRFRLDALKPALERGGARVTLQFLPGVRDRYYFRADATPEEDAETVQLPARVRSAIDSLRQASAVKPAVKAPAARPATPRTVVRGLQPYTGNPLPPPLQLLDLDGRTQDLAQLRGRVVLVNFWASWCPPCVREMPSMQRLKEKLAGRPFTILAVNMAEPDKDVRAFLAKMNVDFPVPMDRDGAVLKRWKVFVFPTSFVLDVEGNIRLGVFGEVEWDNPEVMEKIVALLPAAP